MSDHSRGITRRAALGRIAAAAAFGATGAAFPDASNLLSCSKADAFTR